MSVVARHKAWVWGRSFTGIAGSNPAGDQWRTQEFSLGGGRDSTNSVEDRGQRKRGSGSFSPLVRGSTRFANE
jgi:hypothetical protein